MLRVLSKMFIAIVLLHSILIAREINLNNLSKTAIKSNKTLFVFLHKTDCGYCESMIEFTLDDEKIKPFLKKRFLFVHINITEKDSITYRDFKGSGRDFAKQIGFNFYPTSLFFDEQNDLSYAAPGYQDEKKFFAILHYVDSKSYNKISFRKYENNFDFNKKF